MRIPNGTSISIQRNSHERNAYKSRDWPIQFVMKQIFVCPLQDLPEGAMRSFRVEGRELVFVRSGERVFALRNICPHQGARLSDGMITCQRIAGAVGEYRLRADRCAVRCPWHNWEFDLADGAAMHDPQRIRVSAYQTRINDGQVFLVL